MQSITAGRQLRAHRPISLIFTIESPPPALSGACAILGGIIVAVKSHDFEAEGGKMISLQ
jgi:hypothetical protein